MVPSLKLPVAVQREERPFWQARYYDFNVHNEDKRVEKLRYMHRNPQKRGLVAKPEEWKWSSFLHYATGFEGAVEIESDWTAARRQSSCWVRNQETGPLRFVLSQFSKSRTGAPAYDGALSSLRPGPPVRCLSELLCGLG